MIVKTFLETVPEVEGIECEAISVRPQSLARARALSDEFGIPRIYTGYDELLKDSELDFIYIGVANHVHFDYARRALSAGKNVIMEKPFTPTAREAKLLAELADEKKLFLFEAITSIHMPMFHMLKSRLGELGDAKLVQANFSQYSSRYERYLNGDVFPSFDPDCFGGALYDLNVYNLHIAAALFGPPKSAGYQANLGYNGVDTSGILTMSYDGFKAECCAAKDSGSPCFFMVQGTNGYARILGAPNSCPSLEIEIRGERETFTDPRSDMRMAAELEAFYKIWFDKDYKSGRELMRHSVNVMSVIDMLTEK